MMNVTTEDPMYCHLHKLNRQGLLGTLDDLETFALRGHVRQELTGDVQDPKVFSRPMIPPQTEVEGKTVRQTESCLGAC